MWKDILTFLAKNRVINIWKGEENVETAEIMVWPRALKKFVL